MSSNSSNIYGSVALIGNPNTGKSSLFNALCGMGARVGNYPGVTVEQKVGRLQDSEHRIDIIDLPGTYSLAARSADEAVAVNVLTGDMLSQKKPDAVVVIVDATNIERNLYLFSQVLELELPTLLVLNMWDRLETDALHVDPQGLASKLGIPVLCTSASKRTGIDALRQHIIAMVTSHACRSSDNEVTATSETTLARIPRAASTFPAPFRLEVASFMVWLSERGVHLPAFTVERMLIDSDGYFEKQIRARGCPEISHRIAETRKRLVDAGCRVPMFETKGRYGWIQQLLQGVVERRSVTTASWSDGVDRWLTHRWFGMLFFCVVMFVVFQSITLLAAWPQDQIERLQALVSNGLRWLLAPGALRSLLSDGIVAGVGSVLTFLPQIAILFFFIAVLEDCGYMARAAFVMDKLMSSVGMSGRSFLPLMSSFACAVPGIMATRTIENSRDRMVTLLVAPLMSCSARLPVYLLLVTAFVPATYVGGTWISLQGIVLLMMQSLGAIVAIPVAWLLKKYLFPGEASTFIMELPSYKWPSLRILVHRVWERVLSFVVRAGSLIVVTSILVWGAGYFPGNHRALDSSTAALERLQVMRAEWETKLARSEGDQERMTIEQELAGNANSISEVEQSIGTQKSTLIESSLLGMTGHAIEPLVKPLGWDWRVGVAVIASFPAREVIIATLGTIYSLGGEVDETSDSLKEQMQRSHWNDGRPVFTVATAFSVMVFFALCAQCSATLMTIRRETNSWRWPIFSFFYMTCLAYFGAMLTFQILSIWW